MSQQKTTSGNTNFVEKEPLDFLDYPRKLAEKRSPDERTIDFKEIYAKADDQQLSQQASRCLDCGNPYCEWKCPLHNYIPNWLESVRSGRNLQAAELMYETNPLPEICGRVCPQDRLCEQACTINTGFGAVTIGAIEKNISDQALAMKWRPKIDKTKQSPFKVAIIGAGPAGLACADRLANQGVKPVVYDRYPDIGGLLTFGIPGFKLEKSVMRERKEFLQDIGVEFKLNTEVGKDISIEELRSEYDALFLAMGTYSRIEGNFKGFKAEGFVNALDYLIGNINQSENYQMENFPFKSLKNQKVVVIGGGDTAMDCVRSAIRQQAASVTCIYRRSKEQMPGSPQEVKNAQEEGVEFLFNQQPTSIETDANGQVIGVNMLQTREVSLTNDNQVPIEPPSEQRKAFETIENSERFISADCVITAFGFNPSPEPSFDELGLQLEEDGRVHLESNENNEHSLETNLRNIFAGGDMVRGADLVVTAVADGVQAANQILTRLKQPD